MVNHNKIMILTKQKILDRIEKGEIKIEPFDKQAVGPASIDLALDDEIRVFGKNNQPNVVSENTNYKQITKKKKIGQGYILEPGELVLGITKEKISLPSNISGWLQSRSRFAISYYKNVKARLTIMDSLENRSYNG